MFHGRCDAIIAELRAQLTHLRTELADTRSEQVLERKEFREREEKLQELIRARPAGVPILVQPRRDDPPFEPSADLPPELFDPENALYVGKDIVPEGWKPPHHATTDGRLPKPARTEAGKALQSKVEGSVS